MSFENVGGGVGRRAPRTTDRIYRELVRMIVTLELPPGEVANEVELARRLHCSRTPVREALQRLAQERLVVPVPRRGATVADLSVIDFGELLEALQGVECFAIRLAAERATDEQIEGIAQVLSEAEGANRAGDLVAVAEHDFDFHTRLALISGNRHLVDTIARLDRLITRFSYLGTKRLGTGDMPLAQHHMILDAIRRHDPNEAEQRVREHWQRGREVMRAAF
jgi:DNA-binding GntR family transcriptional regulator